MDYTFPTPLLSLISHPNCIKVGLNIEGDFWKLQRDYGLPLDDLLVGDHKSIVDLSVLANNLLGIYHLFTINSIKIILITTIQMIGKTSKWSLTRLSEYLLNKPILKELQTSDWSVNPLSDAQQRYAAIDAFASYELYFEIKTNAMPFGYN